MILIWLYGDHIWIVRCGLRMGERFPMCICRDISLGRRLLSLRDFCIVVFNDSMGDNKRYQRERVCMLVRDRMCQSGDPRWIV